MAAGEDELLLHYRAQLHSHQLHSNIHPAAFDIRRRRPTLDGRWLVSFPGLVMHVCPSWEFSRDQPTHSRIIYAVYLGHCVVQSNISP